MIRTLTGPLLLGLATGARTTLGLAAVAFARPRAFVRPEGDTVQTGVDRAVGKIQTRAGRITAGTLLLGELTGDKLPQTPSRIEPQGLVGRLLCGALGGAALARRSAVEESLGGTVGLAGALAGSYGGEFVRGWAADQGWADWPVALVEDAVAIVLAWGAGRV